MWNVTLCTIFVPDGCHRNSATTTTAHCQQNKNSVISSCPACHVSLVLRCCQPICQAPVSPIPNIPRRSSTHLRVHTSRCPLVPQRPPCAARLQGHQTKLHTRSAMGTLPRTAIGYVHYVMHTVYNLYDLYSPVSPSLSLQVVKTNSNSHMHLISSPSWPA